jgi:chorismate synthase
MGANSFGSRLIVTSFGESHGAALGVVIDGCPAGLTWDQSLLEKNLSRRKPGQNQTVSARQEPDQVEILSGVYLGKTLGTPIAMITRNHDAKSEDYKKIENQPRAGHADDVWKNKFGLSDPRGGGRSSGRETVARVMAGSVAEMFLKSKFPKMKVMAQVIQIHDRKVSGPPYNSETDQFLSQAKASGESYGGLIELKIENPPANLGQPVFHKLKADLAASLMGIGAVSGVELGKGFDPVLDKGTDFHGQNSSAQYGGIRGGISTGETILMQIKVKPTSSILDVAKAGRHDPFIGTRAVPVIESMAHLVLADHVLWSLQDRI